jgi:hypothetical protein
MHEAQQNIPANRTKPIMVGRVAPRAPRLPTSADSPQKSLPLNRRRPAGFRARRHRPISRYATSGTRARGFRPEAGPTQKLESCNLNLPGTLPFTGFA